MANLVIVADMVRGFCEEGRNLYVGPTIQEIIPRIRELLERERAAGSHIIFVCDTHEPDDKEFEMFPPDCVATFEPDAHIFALKQMQSVLGANVTGFTAAAQ